MVQIEIVRCRQDPCSEPHLGGTKEVVCSLILPRINRHWDFRNRTPLFMFFYFKDDSLICWVFASNVYPPKYTIKILIPKYKSYKMYKVGFYDSLLLAAIVKDAFSDT